MNYTLLLLWPLVGALTWLGGSIATYFGGEPLTVKHAAMFFPYLLIGVPVLLWTVTIGLLELWRAKSDTVLLVRKRR